MRFIGSSAAAHVGIECGVKGPTFGVCSACASGAHAIKHGPRFHPQRAGRRGHRRRLGSSPHLRHDAGVAGDEPAVAARASSRSPGSATAPCWPRAPAFSCSKSMHHAKARGAKILAELCGVGTTSDGTDMVHPDVIGASEAMRLALEDAQTRADRHRLCERARHGHRRERSRRDERDQAARSARTPPALAVSSTKSMHGHPLGASGGIEAVVCIKAMQEGWVPPTLGLDEADPECDLDYTANVGRAKTLDLHDVELVRLHGPERRPRIRPAAGVTRPCMDLDSTCLQASPAPALARARMRSARARWGRSTIWPRMPSTPACGLSANSLHDLLGDARSAPPSA